MISSSEKNEVQLIKSKEAKKKKRKKRKLETYQSLGVKAFGVTWKGYMYC